MVVAERMADEVVARAVVMSVVIEDAVPEGIVLAADMADLAFARPAQEPDRVLGDAAAGKVSARCRRRTLLVLERWCH